MLMINTRFLSLDMIAIPALSFGAMEHWGLVTYRLSRLLYKEDESAVSDQHRINLIVSHELAHQVDFVCCFIDRTSSLSLKSVFDFHFYKYLIVVFVIPS